MGNVCTFLLKAYSVTFATQNSSATVELSRAELEA